MVDNERAHLKCKVLNDVHGCWLDVVKRDRCFRASFDTLEIFWVEKSEAYLDLIYISRWPEGVLPEPLVFRRLNVGVRCHVQREKSVSALPVSRVARHGTNRLQTLPLEE